ncbi:MAG: cellulase-like family protein [Planctomycetota bacterium]|jgi:hypothetical protein
MDRRDFLKAAGVGAVSLASGNLAGCSRVLSASSRWEGQTISKLQKPLAIAMWDLAWLLRYQRGGAFEDWDRCLDELADRGYNAVRIDVFPHLVAADSEGNIEERFFFPRDSWKPALWSNKYSVYARPREGLLEFLGKCRKRGIAVGVSTWFGGDQSKRNEKVEGVDGLVRVWDETLKFIADNGLLDMAVYVDLLNEYPLYHGFGWLKRECKAFCDKIKIDYFGDQEGTADTPDLEDKRSKGWEHKFYGDFMSKVLKRLKAKWPALDFMASLVGSYGRWDQMGVEHFDALDVHYWFVFNKQFAKQVGYSKYIHKVQNDLGFEKVNAAIHEYWKANKKEMIEWMEGKVKGVAEVGKKLGIPYGNTEGWGPVRWMDHPLLDWDWVKASAEVGARLGAKHGYMFNCTSNFTHPHFVGYWEDVRWHKRVTSIIRRL